MWLVTRPARQLLKRGTLQHQELQYQVVCMKTTTTHHLQGPVRQMQSPQMITSALLQGTGIYKKTETETPSITTAAVHNKIHSSSHYLSMRKIDATAK